MSIHANDSAVPASDSFFSRVLGNDALKKGVAGAIAGALVATVSELLWPTAR
jgi:hypothetical protein